MLDQQIVPTDALVVEVSPGFAEWLESQNASLSFSTYRAGLLLTVGVDGAGELYVSAAQFDRVTGIAFNGQSLHVATQDQLWQLTGVATSDDSMKDFDSSFVRSSSQFTGDIGIRDVAIDRDRRPIFVSSRFNCLATISDHSDFQPLWRPSFINRIVGEDRCHLNGVAMVDGKPQFATACARTNYADGWRKHRRDGGILIDIEANEVIVDRLSMPHSPRWYRDQLWLLNAGTGAFGYVDFTTGRFEHFAFCPGFARGLAFTGDYAVIGLSQSRHDPFFEGLPLKQALIDHNLPIRRGLMVMNLETGKLDHWMWMADSISEIFDVLVLPGIKCLNASSLTVVRFPSAAPSGE